MVTQVAGSRRTSIVVRAGGAPLYGISGHQIGAIEGDSQVAVHGEHGPYTIVSFEGRNGYVLTELLESRNDSRRESPAPVSDGIAETAEKPPAWKGWAIFVTSAAAAIGGAAVLAHVF